jgi:hypothetical protein
MANDLDNIESVVTVLVDQIGRAAVRFARNQDESMDALPEMPSAEMWRDIANAIDRLQSPKIGAPASAPVARRLINAMISAL